MTHRRRCVTLAAAQSAFSMEQDVSEYAERLRYLRTKREERTDAWNTFRNSNVSHEARL